MKRIDRLTGYIGHYAAKAGHYALFEPDKSHQYVAKMICCMDLIILCSLKIGR